MHQTLPIEHVFDYSRRLVQPRDIAQFAPADPGYHDYVRLWTRLLQEGTVPRKPDFDLTEVISLTNYTNAEREEDPQRFRRFRALTCTVGMMLMAAGNSSDTVCPPNYLLLRLLEDQRALADHIWSQLLIPALEAFRDHLRSSRLPDEEHPFCLLALILLRLQLGEPAEQLRQAAVDLIADEQAMRNHLDVWRKDFLLGLTVSDQFNRAWRSMVGQTIPADVQVEELALIRAEIIDSGR